MLKCLQRLLIKELSAEELAREQVYVSRYDVVDGRCALSSPGLYACGCFQSTMHDRNLNRNRKLACSVPDVGGCWTFWPRPHSPNAALRNALKAFEIR
jgi:hypothetical protein